MYVDNKGFVKKSTSIKTYKNTYVYQKNGTPRGTQEQLNQKS